jgi:HupE / UreJ protein
VLEHRCGRWQAVASFRRAFFEAFSIVTAFTIAHSITLEPCSVGVHYPAVTAHRIDDCRVGGRRRVEQPLPLIEKRLWVIAFVFGLVHGLGFANVLTDLALPKPALAVSLVSFNPGVESGQLAIVAAFLPLAYLSRRSWFYPRLVLGAGSVHHRVGRVGMAGRTEPERQHIFIKIPGVDWPFATSPPESNGPLEQIHGGAY